MLVTLATATDLLVRADDAFCRGALAERGLFPDDRTAPQG